jgi:hypothetical protein
VSIAASQPPSAHGPNGATRPAEKLSASQPSAPRPSAAPKRKIHSGEKDQRPQQRPERPFQRIPEIANPPIDGRVEIAARRMKGADDMIEIAVSDTSTGMTHEQMARVFTPFEQADPSTTRRFGGTGLGMSIARGLVRAMGGDIVAASTPSDGSTFLIRLPKRADERPPATEDARAAA